MITNACLIVVIKKSLNVASFPGKKAWQVSQNKFSIIMRGQISLEYLLIAIIAIALVSLSVSVLNKIRTNADESYNNIKFKTLNDDIFNSVDEICALGNGNARSLRLSLPVIIKSGTKGDIYFLTILHDKTSMSHETSCEASVDGEFKNEIVIANEDGKIINKP